MSKYNKNAVSMFIRALYSKGLSYLQMSFYQRNFSFRIVPCNGTKNSSLGFPTDRYDESQALITSANYEGAAALYQAAMSILNDKYAGNQVKITIPCNNDTTLELEYRPDQDNQMATFLAINKNNMTNSFKFSTHSYTVRENGQMVTKIIQSGLGAFAKTIDGYLCGVGADLHLSKLPEDYDDDQDNYHP